MLSHLLQAKGYLTVDALLAQIPVSRTTLLKDIDDAEVMLVDSGLSLTRRKHYGFKIEGPELQRRRMLVRFVLKPYGGVGVPWETAVDLDDLRDIIFQAAHDNGADFSEDIFDNIALHVQTLVMRASAQKYLLEDIDILQPVQERFKRIAKTICDHVANAINVEIPAQEASYLALAMSARASLDADDEVDVATRSTVRSILSRLDDEWGTEFRFDTDLEKALGLHTYPLMNRLYCNIQLENPMADDINIRHANVISIACRYAELLEHAGNRHLNEGEIAFIALHFASHFERARKDVLARIKRIAVVGQVRGGVSSILKQSLNLVFPNALVVFISEDALDSVEEELPNLFVFLGQGVETSLHGVPVVHTGIFPDEKDVLAIADVVMLRYEAGNFRGMANDSLPFSRDLFEHIPSDVYENVLSRLSRKMEQNGLAQPGFCESVFEREARFSTIYANGIAGPHALVPMALKDSIGVCILDKPVVHGGQQVQAVFLINLGKNRRFLHKEVAGFLQRLSSDAQARDELLSCSDFNQFVFTARRFLH